MGFVQRAFTPGGGEAPEAVAARAAGEATKAAEAKAIAAPPPPTAAKPPAPPPTFQPGSAPAKLRAAQQTATTLGEAAIAGQTAQKRATLG